ncbi:MAG: thioredoxin-like domain-containing protein [Planctomycetota bacterium]|jgi:sugar lactone lactonase YvrE
MFCDSRVGRSTPRLLSSPSFVFSVRTGLLLTCLSLLLSLTLLPASTAAQDEPAAAKKDDPAKPPADPNVVIGEDGKPIENPFPKRFPAPELDGGHGWLNTSGDITLKDLRGKVVLIDFWTYCCINCMHVLPDLHYLEHKYPDELVVIGCHSAKFDNEKDTEAIRRAIVRYEIEHPVINDADMIVWRKFQARAWPTIVLIDPEGNFCGYVSGEGNRELLDTVIQRVITWHKAKGTLDTTPVRFDLERDRMPSGPLRFPGKLLADPGGKRLFISDSNHNRIVVSSLDGELIDVIGSGRIGSKDGSFAEAQFDHPQGMALSGNSLFVADTENHQLRVVDLASKTVSTLAGTGEQARFRASGGPLKTTALNSPWDLTVVDDTLFVAMAGPHQIWSHKLGSEEIAVFSGSGREDILDGPHDMAALAQPSGIVSDGKFLYVADSEGSAIRQIAVDPKGDVKTLIGAHDLPSGRSLFTFGDMDGIGNDVRLQHPLGVLLNGQTLFIADAYNHKIKAVDLKTRQTTTLLGDGDMGTGLEPVELHEPAGMTIAGQRLFVADTNNHRIVEYNLETKKAREFVVTGLVPPKPPKVSDLAGSDDAKKPSAEVAEATLAVGEQAQVEVTLQIPEGYKLNDLAPVRARLAIEGDQSIVAAESLSGSTKAAVKDNVARFPIRLTGQAGKATVKLSVTYSYCRGGTGGLCKIHTARWTVPISAAQGGKPVLSLKTDLPK